MGSVFLWSVPLCLTTKLHLFYTLVNTGQSGENHDTLSLTFHIPSIALGPGGEGVRGSNIQSQSEK